MTETDVETVVVTHWRAVSEDGGIALSYSTRDDAAFRSRQRVEQFCAEHPQYHLEVWEQVFRVTPSEWRHIETVAGAGRVADVPLTASEPTLSHDRDGAPTVAIGPERTV